jgi:hypothetical protein
MERRFRDAVCRNPEKQVRHGDGNLASGQLVEEVLDGDGDRLAPLLVHQRSGRGIFLGKQIEDIPERERDGVSGLVDLRFIVGKNGLDGLEGGKSFGQFLV